MNVAVIVGGTARKAFGVIEGEQAAVLQAFIWGGERGSLAQRVESR